MIYLNIKYSIIYLITLTSCYSVQSIADLKSEKKEIDEKIKSYNDNLPLIKYLRGKAKKYDFNEKIKKENQKKLVLCIYNEQPIPISTLIKKNPELLVNNYAAYIGLYPVHLALLWSKWSMCKMLINLMEKHEIEFVDLVLRRWLGLNTPDDIARLVGTMISSSSLLRAEIKGHDVTGATLPFFPGCLKNLDRLKYMVSKYGIEILEDKILNGNIEINGLSILQVIFLSKNLLIKLAHYIISVSNKKKLLKRILIGKFRGYNSLHLLMLRSSPNLNLFKQMVSKVGKDILKANILIGKFRGYNSLHLAVSHKNTNLISFIKYIVSILGKKVLELPLDTTCHSLGGMNSFHIAALDGRINYVKYMISIYGKSIVQTKVCTTNINYGDMDALEVLEKLGKNEMKSYLLTL